MSTGASGRSGPSGPVGPYAGWRGRVRPEWVDYNAHMADWAYGVVCAEANEAFLEHLGVSAAYRERTGCSTYTVESHLRYLAEVGPDAELRAESVLVDADAKRLRVRTSVFDGDGTQVLTGEYLFLHVDASLGKVVPFPPDRAAVIEAARAAWS
ncbi:thioesterase family protein [Oryzihumus sp.]